MGYETRQLELWTKRGNDDPEEIGGGLADEVLRTSRGVQVLLLDNTEKLCSAALFQPSFAGEPSSLLHRAATSDWAAFTLPCTDVKSLTLRSVSFTAFPEPRPLPQGLSRLNTLNVELYLEGPTTASLVAALLQVGPGSAVLELYGDMPTTRKKRRRRPLRSLSPPLAPLPSPPVPTLKVLDVTLYDSDSVEWLSSTLSQCTSIKTLRYNRLEPTMFSSLGSQLRELNITRWIHDEEDCDCVCLMLRGNFWSLQRLKRLSLECHPSSELPSSGRLAIEHECEARGIECIWVKQE
jgi:hypothetical protein